MKTRRRERVGGEKCKAGQNAMHASSRAAAKKEGYRTSSGTLNRERSMAGDHGQPCLPKNGGRSVVLPRRCRASIQCWAPAQGTDGSEPARLGNKGSPQFWVDGRAGGQQFTLGAYHYFLRRPGTHRMGAKRRKMKECWGGPRGKHGWSRRMPLAGRCCWLKGAVHADMTMCASSRIANMSGGSEPTTRHLSMTDCYIHRLTLSSQLNTAFMMGARCGNHRLSRLGRP
ncbi:hypothetical protein MAPG_02931 [Magnaporthiopsis poae ATCC 64411]|uniref:Uncharacterized protein n=1 Tax=Magnaporthiopsis poae (strain ATCC 64411 / 73-15) TaxID=644358 RepID=A0A0C4DSP6_MAGP6|nr:hypothetical protein MAPG_02931 [Magnaporthiopsis poae ATCC 64411]